MKTAVICLVLLVCQGCFTGPMAGAGALSGVAYSLATQPGANTSSQVTCTSGLYTVVCREQQEQVGGVDSEAVFTSAVIGAAVGLVIGGMIDIARAPKNAVSK